MSISALVLAAGGSARLGRPKQLEKWGTTNLLGAVMANTSSFPVDEVWVVLGCEIDRVLAETDLGDAGVVENPEWEEGIASSIRVGLDALTRLSRSEQVLIALGDQPGISGSVVAEMLVSHVRAKRQVTIPKYLYGWGNPIVVDRSMWPRLMSLAGDEGGSRLWKAHPEWVNEVSFSDLAPRDVDTEVDVVELRPRHPA